MSAPVLELELTAAGPAPLPAGPEWLAPRREEALERFARRGLPGPREEAWRYTRLAPLARRRWRLAEAAGTPPVDRNALEEAIAPAWACNLFVFVDGRLHPGLGSPEPGAGAHRVEELEEARDSVQEAARFELGRHVDAGENPLVDLNTSLFRGGALVHLAAHEQAPQPIHLVHLAHPPAGRAEGEPFATHPRTLVLAGAGSRVTLIEDHVRLEPGPNLTNAVTELVLEPGAEVDLVRILREGEGSHHLSAVGATVSRDARLRIHSVIAGGEFSRADIQVVLAEPGASCELFGVGAARGSELFAQRTRVEHAAPHATSRQIFRSVAADRSRSVFDGLVRVHVGARGTSAEQRSENLLLSDRAEVDARPQLEIDNDDVRCSHGATIGQLDRETLFYLRSRGLPEADALRLLLRAFLAGVLRELPAEALREHLADSLGGRIGGGGLP